MLSSVLWGNCVFALNSVSAKMVDETASLDHLHRFDQTNLSLKGEVCGQAAFT